MNRSKFIQGLNSNIELSDKERRRAIRNSINKRPCGVYLGIRTYNQNFGKL